MYRVKLNYETIDGKKNIKAEDVYASLFGDKESSFYTKEDGSLKTVNAFSDEPLMNITYKNKKFLRKAETVKVGYITKVTPESIFIRIDHILDLIPAFLQVKKMTGLPFEFDNIDYVK